jgi:hypothetical protein
MMWMYLIIKNDTNGRKAIKTMLAKSTLPAAYILFSLIIIIL